MLKKTGKKLGTLLTVVAIFMVMGIVVAKPVVANAAEYDENGNLIGLDTPYVEYSDDGFPTGWPVNKDGTYDNIYCHIDPESTDAELCVIDLNGKVLKTFKYSKSNPKHKYIIFNRTLEVDGKIKYTKLPKKQVYGYKVRTSCVSNGKTIYSDWFDLSCSYITEDDKTVLLSSYQIPKDFEKTIKRTKNRNSIKFTWGKFKGVSEYRIYTWPNCGGSKKILLGTVKGNKTSFNWKSTNHKKYYKDYLKYFKKNKYPNQYIYIEPIVKVNGKKMIVSVGYLTNKK